MKTLYEYVLACIVIPTVLLMLSSVSLIFLMMIEGCQEGWCHYLSSMTIAVPVTYVGMHFIYFCEKVYFQIRREML
jgi:hypothetical protein